MRINCYVIFILIVIGFKYSHEEVKENEFVVENDVDISKLSTVPFVNYQTHDSLTCLAQCLQYRLCIGCIYVQNSNSSANCMLFDRYVSVTKVNASTYNSAALYLKDGEYTVFNYAKIRNTQNMRIV